MYHINQFQQLSLLAVTSKKRGGAGEHVPHTLEKHSLTLDYHTVITEVAMSPPPTPTHSSKH